jgi:hypothetical protein
MRRSGALLLAAGLACLTSAAFPLVGVHADEEPGSGFGAFALSANAPVMQAQFDYAAQRCSVETAGTAGCEGVVNESVSQLSNGPVGHALSSVTWPGTLAGNLGSLLITAGGGNVPPEANQLNSPIRAEALTGAPAPVVNDYPPAPAPTLAHMRAEVKPAKVTAEAALGGVQQAAIGSLGASTSRSSAELTGVATARATAHAEVQDINIGGVLRIGAVVSDASATTDGVKAGAKGRTEVTGATVAGIPVTIDENGVTVQTQNVPLPTKQLTDAVNGALSQAGLTVALSEPHGTPVGSAVSYDAGALVVLWKPQADTAFRVVIGGAQVAVSAGPGFDFGGPTTGTTGGLPGGTTTGGVSVPPPLTGGGDAPPVLGGTDVPPAVGGPLAPVLSATHAPYPSGLSPWLVTLAVVGAGLMMAGLRRLPDRVLVAAGGACPNGEAS